MKTKIVYVVTCSEKNTYLEQALVSVYSARLHNPDARIYIVTDEISAKYIESSRTEIKKYLTDVLVFDTPEDYNSMKRSRYLKTNLRELIEGDFVYIDTDTVICQPLDELDNFTDDVSGVANRHELYNVSKQVESNAVFRTLGANIKENFVYINGGLLIVKDTPVAHSLFNAWHECWMYSGTKGMFMDQPPLHMAELKAGYKIKDVSGIWNCQIEGACLNYIHDAKILHFYAVGGSGKTSPYLLRQDKVYDVIKRLGYIPEDVLKNISHPYEAFTPNNAIVAESKKQFIEDTFWLFMLYREHPSVCRAILKPIQGCIKFVRSHLMNVSK